MQRDTDGETLRADRRGRLPDRLTGAALHRAVGIDEPPTHPDRQGRPGRRGRRRCRGRAGVGAGLLPVSRVLARQLCDTLDFLTGSVRTGAGSAAPLIIDNATTLLAATLLTAFPALLAERGEPTRSEPAPPPAALRRATAFIELHAHTDIGLRQHRGGRAHHAARRAVRLSSASRHDTDRLPAAGSSRPCAPRSSHRQSGRRRHRRRDLHEVGFLQPGPVRRRLPDRLRPHPAAHTRELRRRRKHVGGNRTSDVPPGPEQRSLSVGDSDPADARYRRKVLAQRSTRASSMIRNIGGGDRCRPVDVVRDAPWGEAVENHSNRARPHHGCAGADRVGRVSEHGRPTVGARRRSAVRVSPGGPHRTGRHRLGTTVSAVSGRRRLLTAVVTALSITAVAGSGFSASPAAATVADASAPELAPGPGAAAPEPPAFRSGAQLPGGGGTGPAAHPRGRGRHRATTARARRRPFRGGA